jgi:hypothetical protein
MNYKKLTENKIITKAVTICLVLALTITSFYLQTISAEEKRVRDLITSISLNDERFIIYGNRSFTTPRVITELTGANVDWIEGKDSDIIATISINFPSDVFGKEHKNVSINCFLIRGSDTQSAYQQFIIDKTDYYFIQAPQYKENSKSFISLRGVLEPLFELQYKPETRVIEIYNNPFYNRVKLLSQSSEIIINYELHKLNSGLIKQNKEVFISLREFIELISGKIEYNPTSQYNSPEIIIKPVNIKKEINIYPQLNKAILINEDNQIKEINFLNKLINKNGSHFIGINDMISKLEAKRHNYLDSDINAYFNFEF